MRNMYVYFAPAAFLERKKPEVSGLSLFKDCWKTNKQTSKQSCFVCSNRLRLLMTATVFSYWFGSRFWMNKFFHNNLEIKKIICLSAQCYKDIHRGAELHNMIILVYVYICVCVCFSH